MNNNLPDVSKIDRLKHMYTNPETFMGIKNTITECIDLSSLKKLSPAQKKQFDTVTNELVMAYGLKNGIWASNLARGKYYSTLAQIRNDVVKDFNCQTSLELMLADRIVAHYWRAMRTDALINRLNEEEDGGYSFNQQKINLIRELYRGVDLSDRQLNTNIILLKGIKQPQLNIKVTTENAFIAQNQQINVDNKTNEAK